MTEETPAINSEIPVDGVDGMDGVDEVHEVHEVHDIDPPTDELDPNAAAGTSDGLIGSRRIRTFLIGGLLIAYCVLTMIYYFRSVQNLGGWLGFLSVMIGLCELVLIISISIAIALHCLNKEGGIETAIGWVVTITAAIMVLCQMLTFTNLSGQYGGVFFIIVSEGTLPGFTALFLGLDILKDFMSKESRRLFWNLLLLAVSAGFGFVGYASFSSVLGRIGFGNGPYALITIGYLIILSCSVAYLVLNLCACVTCGSSLMDNCIIRLVIAGGLIGGGVLTAIGYWAASAQLGDGDFAVGYSVLLGGLCVTWGIDMGIVDTIKNSSAKKPNHNGGDVTTDA